MGRYLPVRSKGANVAIAVCSRCSFKCYYADLKQDPNTKQFLCVDCCDLYDPWSLPAKLADHISLTHPRPDSSVSTVGTEDYTLGNEMNFAIEFVDGVTIGTNP